MNLKPNTDALESEKKCNHACSPSDYYKGGKCDKMGCFEPENNLDSVEEAAEKTASNMMAYWNSFDPIDREILLSEVHVSTDLAVHKFENLPWFIRYMFYAYFYKVWLKNINHEFNP